MKEREPGRQPPDEEMNRILLSSKSVERAASHLVSVGASGNHPEETTRKTTKYLGYLIRAETIAFLFLLRTLPQVLSEKIKTISLKKSPQKAHLRSRTLLTPWESDHF